MCGVYHGQTGVDVLWAYTSESQSIWNTDLCAQSLGFLLSSFNNLVIPAEAVGIVTFIAYNDEAIHKTCALLVLYGGWKILPSLGAAHGLTEIDSGR